MLSEFPHLTTPEFEAACNGLMAKFDRHGSDQKDWQTVENVCQHETKYLRITKSLPNVTSSVAGAGDGDEQDELEEDDDEVLQTTGEYQPLILYDILLSPVYRVPVLYISISDTQHRYPPTMATLYEHLIPPQFKAQAENGGVIGGISIQDHPATNRPVFFIHPCQTAEVLEASVDKQNITAEEYLVMWIGALGKCVGLNVPLALMQRDAPNSTKT